jgi:hypothetical protein
MRKQRPDTHLLDGGFENHLVSFTSLTNPLAGPHEAPMTRIQHHQHHHHPHVGHQPPPAVAADTAKAAQALAQAAQALAQAVSSFAKNPSIAQGGCWAPPPPAYVPPCRCFPPPAPEQSSPPAGAGLTTGGDFGPNAVKTAGGYTIVANGNTSWDVFGPGQKPGEKPMTNVSGDPHVLESDGTRWDFSQNSSFRLPDGTNIAVTTSAQTGYSVSKGLDITNGADRIQISGVDSKATLGAITHDGFKARADLAAQDTFLLGGDGKGKVQWFKETAGKIEGEVVGASMVNKDGAQSYVQKVDGNSQYVVDPSLQPKPGTEAWGNMLRDQAVDAVHDTFGAGSSTAETVAAGADKDHTQVMQQQAAQAAQEAQLGQLKQLIDQLMKLFSMLNLGGGFNTGGGVYRPINSIPVY